MTIKVRHQTGKTNTYIHPYCINGHANPPKSYKRGLHVTSLTQNGHLEAPQPGPHIKKIIMTYKKLMEIFIKTTK